MIKMGGTTDDMKNAYDVLTAKTANSPAEIVAASIMQPRIKANISYQVRMLVSNRIKLYFQKISEDRRREYTTPLYNYDYLLTRLRERLEASWPESIAKYREICKILDLETLEE